jgi:hypothetical protein
MKTDYASSNCEQRARELLAPVTGVCPDSVWENISIELEANRKEAENTWLNKLNNTPRTPLIAAAVVVVITLSSWLILSHKSTNKTETVAQVTPVPVSNTTVATIASITTPEVKKDNDIKPVVFEENTSAQQVKQGLVMNGRSGKRQGMNSNIATQNQSATEDKDDGKPIMIHNAGGPQVITSDEPASKGVAVDLGGDDNSNGQGPSGASSAQTRAVRDSTGQ